MLLAHIVSYAASPPYTIEGEKERISVDWVEWSLYYTCKAVNRLAITTPQMNHAAVSFWCCVLA